MEKDNENKLSENKDDMLISEEKEEQNNTENEEKTSKEKRKEKSNKAIDIPSFAAGILFCVAFAMLTVVCVNVYLKQTGHEMLNITKIRLIEQIIGNKYDGEIDAQKLKDGMYYGMVAFATDRYSTYITKNEYEHSKENTSGNYAGIGILINYNSDGEINIKGVFENSPAEKAGIKSGDILVGVEDLEGDELTPNKAMDKVRGEEGTFVSVRVRTSEGKEREYKLERKNIDIPTVSYCMLEGKIGYIRISAFEGVTFGQYENAFNELKTGGMERLIIDLRDNGGGLVDSVKEIADSIVPEGVITYTEDKYGKKEYINSEKGEIDIPLVVIVNGNSASASEMLAGCIRDHKKGKLIGTTTYGKGVVQSIFELGDGTALKLTTSRYYTPSGECIDGVGITPDVEVEASEGFILDRVIREKEAVDVSKDIQLKKAVELVKE